MKNNSATTILNNYLIFQFPKYNKDYEYKS